MQNRKMKLEMLNLENEKKNCMVYNKQCST
jgi:hypothetical protein